MRGVHFVKRGRINLEKYLKGSVQLHSKAHHHPHHQTSIRSMSNQYDDIERKFGIAAYASPHEGFAAVVKARYSDFVVHEVDLKGNIARLESLELPQQNATKVESKAVTKPDVDATVTVDDTDRKRKLSESAEQPMPAKCSNNNENDDTDIKSTTVHWESRKADLTKLIGETPSEEIVSFLKQHETGDGKEAKDDNIQKFYTLPVISDKQARRSVHILIKSDAFSPIARADTHDGRIRVWHKKFESDMPADTFTGARGGGGGDRNRNNSNNKGGKRGGGGGNNNRTPWPRDRPDFLRFVLYKENIDTTTASKDICRTAHLNPKRGIGYAGMKDKRGITTQFCSVYRMEKEQLLAVNATGNAEAEGVAGGGNTSGNGASIIKLGNFEYSSDECRLGTLNGNRFDIVLRNIDVGADPGDTNLVKERLEHAGSGLKTHGFINYFGMQRFGKFFDTHQVGISIMKGEFDHAIDIIMMPKTDESPRIAEARQQWATRFDSIDVAKDENAARDAEMNCARDIQKKLGRFMNCEKSIVNSLSRKPRDYKRAFGSIAKNMRSMFLHAYQSLLFNLVASHRIETGGSTNVSVGDLVLVEDKSPGKGGGGTSGLKGKSVKLLDEQDIKDGKYSITDVVLPLAGSKITYPGGSSGELFDELLKKDGLSRASFKEIGKLDRELSLGGDYRKLICKPSDVSFEVLTYTDPVQPLLQTDLMKVRGIDITATKLGDETNVATEGTGEETMYGMVIGFSLPPSSYATIALRELTKRPTSSEYQSKLELSGKCERNIAS